MVRIRGESKLRPRAVRVPVPSESGSWTVPGWGPPVRVSVRSFLEWVPGPGRYRKPTLPVQASSNFISLGSCVTTRRLVLPQREANRSLPFVPKGTGNKRLFETA